MKYVFVLFLALVVVRPVAAQREEMVTITRAQYDSLRNAAIKEAMLASIAIDALDYQVTAMSRYGRLRALLQERTQGHCMLVLTTATEMVQRWITADSVAADSIKRKATQ